MASAKVVASWRERGMACLAVRVEEGGALGAVEYIGRVPVAELAGLTGAQQKAKLVAAVKAVRDEEVAGVVDLGITGNVSI